MEIEIRKQRQMTFRETLEFCSSSLRHRFSRSLLTLAVIVLAVSFFMYLQCDQIFRARIQSNVGEEIQQSRRGARLASWLFSSYTLQDFLRGVAAADPELAAAFGRYFSWEEASAAHFFRTAELFVTFEAFFRQIPPGKRQVLTRSLGWNHANGQSAVANLTEDSATPLIRRCRALGIRIPLKKEELQRLAAELSVFQIQSRQAYRKWTSLQNKLWKHVHIAKGKNGHRLLAELTPDEEEKIFAFLAANHFTIDRKYRMQMLIHLSARQAKEKISAHLMQPAVRKEWRRRFGTGRYSKLNEKLSIIDAPECRDFAGDVGDAERKLVAETTRRQLELNRLETIFLPGSATVSKPDGSRMIYLMTLAFLVCVTGITNAILMNITERFSEIATLKCLGATDLFILMQILLEAVIHGISGGAAGAVLGLASAVLSNLIQSGLRIFEAWDWGALGISSFYAVAAGVLLTVFSAIYPAFKAARMAPVEAMRVQ